MEGSTPLLNLSRFANNRFCPNSFSSKSIHNTTTQSNVSNEASLLVYKPLTFELFRAPKKSTKKSQFGKKSNLSDSEEEYEGPLNLLLTKKPFKNPHYKTVKKNKNLKQILTMERDKVYALDVPTYENIECAPSVLPQKKYCDITGLNAKYTDPKTGLRYHNAEIYQFIRTLGVPNVQAYLGSRNAAVVLK
ncbi:chromatin-remodeling complex subunit ies6 [Mucor circinelloides]